VNDLVSILIPAFNAEKWIGATIESALRQTWHAKEVIVVDDGSTDGTLSIARRYVAEGVVVDRHSNQGAASTRNRVFALSRGNYIQWLDADDILAPDKIEKQMAVLRAVEDRSAVCTCTWGHFYFRTGKARLKPSALWATQTPMAFMLARLQNCLFMPNMCWLASRELTSRIGPWNTSLTADDDGEFFTRLVLASSSVCFVPEAKAYYRISGRGSLSHIAGSERKLRSQFLSMELQIQHTLKASDSAETRAACLQCVQDFLPAVYPENDDLVRRAQALARELGGELRLAGAPQKYQWIERLCGVSTAKRVQSFWTGIRTTAESAWDARSFRLESRRLKQDSLVHDKIKA
jgi:GT2 family glycosyltransferase